jgi:hypothetical protein
LKGHVLRPKGLMDVVLKENKFEVPIWTGAIMLSGVCID